MPRRDPKDCTCSYNPADGVTGKCKVHPGRNVARELADAAEREAKRHAAPPVHEEPSKSPDLE